ncbi:hypothetical protein AURDEDRAFT_160252 [Auricularia subglabra TFB-10046 SS5]|nr:hypothetical protein AURDEDRAFT_160252 [Auricularia subglabra TFB-10046 SS5]
MSKRSKRPRSQPSLAADNMQPQTWKPLDPYWNDIRTAYAVAGGLLWPQDPSAQGVPEGRATMASAAAAEVLSAGQAGAGLVASEGSATGGPFTFGQDNQRTSFECTVPPGPAVAAALAPSADQHTPATAADPSDRNSSGQAARTPQDASDHPVCDFTSPLAWWYFIVDLWEAISTNANSFKEVWCRYLGPTAESSTSTSALGPRAQENQNFLARHMLQACILRAATVSSLAEHVPTINVQIQSANVEKVNLAPLLRGLGGGPLHVAFPDTRTAPGHVMISNADGSVVRRLRWGVQRDTASGIGACTGASAAGYIGDALNEQMYHVAS